MNRKFALQFGYLCTCVCVGLCVVYYAALGNYICYPISVKLCLLADERAREIEEEEKKEQQLELHGEHCLALT